MNLIVQADLLAVAGIGGGQIVRTSSRDVTGAVRDSGWCVTTPSSGYLIT